MRDEAKNLRKIAEELRGDHYYEFSKSLKSAAAEFERYRVALKEIKELIVMDRNSVLSKRVHEIARAALEGK
jgi:phage tail tape-measure protein